MIKLLLWLWLPARNIYIVRPFFHLSIKIIQYRYDFIYGKQNLFLFRNTGEIGNMPEDQRTCREIRERTGRSENMPENQKTCREIRERTGRSENMPEDQRTCQEIRERTGRSENVPEDQRTCRKIREYAGKSENMPENHGYIGKQGLRRIRRKNGCRRYCFRGSSRALGRGLSA